MNSTTKIIIGALLIIAVAGYGGFKLGKSQSFSGRQNQLGLAVGAFGSQGGVRGGRSNGLAGGMISGDILKKDSQSLTLQLRNGGSKIVWFSTSTEVSKMAAGGLNDLTPGKAAVVNGLANPDGSIVAKTIQLRPGPLVNR